MWLRLAVATLLPVLIAAPPGAGAAWQFYPLKAGDGQAAVKCGDGFVVKWFVGEGDYVEKGDPVCETCPREGGQSRMCTSPLTGYMVAEQPLGPHDAILASVPNGIVAVVEQPPSLHPLKAAGGCRGVLCGPGTSFVHFYVAEGDVVEQGSAIALALTREGLITHCRAPVGGTVISLEEHLRRGEQIGAMVPNRTVACLGPPYSQKPSPSPGTAPLAAAAAQVDDTDSMPSDSLPLTSEPMQPALPTTELDAAAAVTPADRVLRRLTPAAIHHKHHTCAVHGQQHTRRSRSVVVVSMQVHNVRRFALVDDVSVEKLFVSAVRGGLMQAAGPGMVPEDVAVEVLAQSPGSDRASDSLRGRRRGTMVVRATLTCPAGMSASMAHARLCSSAGGASEYVTAKLSKVPSMRRDRGTRVFVSSLGCNHSTSELKAGAVTSLATGATRRHHGKDVHLSCEVHNIDPAALDRHRIVKKAFVKAIKEAMAGAAGSSVRAEHVRAAVIMQGRSTAKARRLAGMTAQIVGDVTPPSGVSACSVHAGLLSPSLGGDMAARLAKIPGIQSVSRGRIIVSSINIDDPLWDAHGGQGRCMESDGGANGPGGKQSGHKSMVAELAERPKEDGVGHNDGADLQTSAGFVKNPDSPSSLLWTLVVLLLVGVVCFLGYFISDMKSESRGRPVVYMPLTQEAAQEAAQEDPGKVRIVFETGGGKTKTLHFEYQPFGAELSKEAPFKVDSFVPDSYAKACGVEVGWAITWIGEAAVILEAGHGKLINDLHSALSGLPQEPKGLRVEFTDHSDRLHIVYFRRQPLGIRHAQHAPAQVEGFEFNSYARERGVEVGWVITRVDQQQLHGSASLEEVERLLCGHSLQPWPLRLDFDRGHGSVKTFFFEQKPLGIEFTSTAPFKIDHFPPDSQGEVCGLGLKWVLVRVGDVDVSSCSNATELTRYLTRGVDHLPQISKGLEVEFADTDGYPRVLYFQRRPLGIVFGEEPPVRVEDFIFNSYARERGVETGWAVTRVGDQSISPTHGPGEVTRRLQEQSAHLPIWPLRVDFATTTGDVKTFHFEIQPLGMEFTRSAPFKVHHFMPDSYAKACGCDVGWTVTRVQDIHLGHDSTYGALMKYITEGCAHLAHEQTGLRVDFLDQGGSTKTCYFQRWPLGIVLKPAGSGHAKVDSFKFNSYARHMGVHTGWCVVRVANFDFIPSSGGRDPVAVVEEWLHEQSSNMALWPLRMDFTTCSGEVRTMYLQQRGLGIEFEQTAPFKIRRLLPDSHVKAHGAEVGWSLVQIGDVAVDSLTTFDHLMKYLEDGTAHLPEEPEGIRVDFVDQAGAASSLHFVYQPLGVVLTGNAPVRVSGFEFNSYAKERGVQEGWMIVRIGGQDLRHGHTGEEVNGFLCERLQDLPVYPLRVDFEVGPESACCGWSPGRGGGGGPATGAKVPHEGRSIRFEQKPLGMVFPNRAPLTVSRLHPASAARSRGVEQGWVVTRIGDVDVRRDANFEQLLQYLGEGLRPLPRSGSDPLSVGGPDIQRGPRSFAC